MDYPNFVKGDRYIQLDIEKTIVSAKFPVSFTLESFTSDIDPQTQQFISRWEMRDSVQNRLR
jgi:hypothetical protein